MSRGFLAFVMGFPGVSGITSKWLPGFFGPFRFFPGKSEGFVGVTLRSATVSTGVPGFFGVFYGVSGGFRYNVKMFTGVFRAFPVLSGEIWGVRWGYLEVRDRFHWCPGGFRRFLWGFRGFPGVSGGFRYNVIPIISRHLTISHNISLYLTLSHDISRYLRISQDISGYLLNDQFTQGIYHLTNILRYPKINHNFTLSHDISRFLTISHYISRYLTISRISQVISGYLRISQDISGYLRISQDIC